MDASMDLFDNFIESFKKHVKNALEKFIPKPQHNSHNNSEVEIKREFENQSNVDVAIVDRNDMVFSYHGNSRHISSDGKFVIRDVYTFKSHASAVRFYENLVKRKEAKGFQGQMAEILIERFTKRQPVNGLEDYLHTFGIEYTFDIKQLNKDAWVYLNNADIVIGRLSTVEHMPHVSGESGIRQMTFEALLKQSMDDKFSHAVIYDIVDDERVNEKYFSSMLAGVPDLAEVKRFEVYKRKPIQVFDSLKAGIRRVIVTRDDNNEIKAKTEVVPLEEANKVGIYNSFEAALTNGRPELLQQSKITQMTMELEKLRSDNLMQKEKITAAELIYKEKNQALADYIDKEKFLRTQLESETKLNEERELSRLKIEKEEASRKVDKKKQKEDQKARKQNSEYEKKSIKRKDKSEKSKFTLGMIASIASLVVGLFTLFKRA